MIYKQLILLLILGICQNIQAQNYCIKDIVFITKVGGKTKAYDKTTNKLLTGKLYDDCNWGEKKTGYTDYKNGLIDGLDVSYYEDGKVNTIYHYSRGELNGSGKEYDKYGKIYFWAEFKNGDTLKVIKDNRKEHAIDEQPLQYLPATFDTSTMQTTLQIARNKITINLLNKKRRCAFVDTMNIFVQQKDSLLYISNICDTAQRYMCAEGIVMARIIEHDSLLTLYYNTQPQIKYVDINLLYTYYDDTCSAGVNKDRQLYILATAYAYSPQLLVYRKKYIIKE